jgi:uroporphyrinogen-III decarboxylase
MKEAKTFCKRHGVLLSGRSQGVADVMFWLSGAENVILMAMESPEMLQRYVDLVAAWNMERIRMQLEAGAELIIRRGWYEATDFWSPSLYRRFLFPPLKREVDAVHAAGAFLTYSMNSGAGALLPLFRELRFDVLGNVDPLIPGVDLGAMKKGIGDLITLYGGVNNYTVIEQGAPEQVRKATREAVERLGPSGFVLGPGDTLDCLLEYGETTERNFYTMIEAWKECR